MALFYFRMKEHHLALNPLVFKLTSDLFELFVFLEVIFPSDQLGLQVAHSGSLHLLRETWKPKLESKKLVSWRPRRTSNF